MCMKFKDIGMEDRNVSSGVHTRHMFVQAAIFFCVIPTIMKALKCIMLGYRFTDMKVISLLYTFTRIALYYVIKISKLKS